MPTFFSASLLAIAVVAGIAAVWLRGRSSASKGKKHDEEFAVDSSVEIVVENDKPKSVTKAAANPASKQSSASIANAITNTLSLDLVNRRQYVKAVCDRFESWTSKATESEDNVEEATRALVKPVALGDQESAPTNAASAFQSKAKPNNLSSFVRQCVSNIERASFVPSSRTISPRNSMSSNQADSPPKTVGRRLPSLVGATDYKLQDDYDPEEYAVEEDTFAKPLLSRTPSDLARTSLAGKPPLLAPFATTKVRSTAPSTLPPVWARMVKQEAPVMHPLPAPIVKAAEPEDDESPVDVTPQSTLMFAMQDEEPAEPVVIPPPPRKISNTAARLQQFQLLVPSNQARVSY